MNRLSSSVCLLALVAISCGKSASDPTVLNELGADPAVVAMAGEARAGVIRPGLAGEAALFGGVNAEGAAGDVKIYNSQVQFIIQGPYSSHGLIDVGGGIIDADLVRTDGTLGRDTIEDVFLGFGLSRLFHASYLDVVNDGSNGQVAEVRTRGTDVPWAYFMGTFEQDRPTLDDLNLDITQIYRLAPDSPSLEIRTEIRNYGTETEVFVLEDGLFASGEDVRPWAAGGGFDGPDSGSVDAVLFAGKSGEATLSMWPAQGSYNISALSALASGLGITLSENPEVVLEPGQTTSYTRYLTLSADVAGAEAERLQTLGVPLGTVAGTVVDADGTPVAGARIHLVDAAEAVVSLAMSDALGRFQIQAPAGEYTAYLVAHETPEWVSLPSGAGRYGPYTAESVNSRQLDLLRGDAQAPRLAFAMGTASPVGLPVSLTANAEAALSFQVDGASGVHIEIEDDAGDPLPALIELRWTDGAPPISEIPASLHGILDIDGGSRAAWAWTADGQLDLPALPGTYELRVNHSWRYDNESLPDVVVSPGQMTDISVVLDEVVPADNWLSLDPHLHGSPSFDGALPMEDRLITCAATGVDLPVSTDHDAMADYRPLASALGLDGQLQVIPGLEVTTVLRGHFNLFPTEPKPLSELNGGAVAWWLPLDDTQALFDRMAETVGEDALVQVNHPRSPGMFGFGDYDKNTGIPSKPDRFSWDFDAFELLNGAADDIEGVREDWFSFLRAGIVKTPTGASDSHYRYIPCGQARTDLFLGVDSPEQTTPSAVREALLAGHVVVASGTTLRAELTVDGNTGLPGDTLSGGAGRLSARVQTPDWIEPGTLRVYQEGLVIFEQLLVSQDEDGVWFDGGWDVDAAGDSWFVVEVQGTESQGDAWRNTAPYAVTNAFFLDVDGGGWSAP